MSAAVAADVSADVSAAVSAVVSAAASAVSLLLCMLCLLICTHTYLSPPLHSSLIASSKLIVLFSYIFLYFIMFCSDMF
jgi:hypothetical protein